MQVEAIQAMQHNGDRARGERFVVSPQHANQLIAKGLARAVRPPVTAPARGAAVAIPSPAAGAMSSASPAAPALPQTTAKRSGSGARKRRAGP